MTDTRFPSPGVDTRFPSPGVDARFALLGVDDRFDLPGIDDRFMGEGGEIGLPENLSAPVLSGGDSTPGTVFLDRGIWAGAVGYQYRYVLDAVEVPGANGLFYETPETSGGLDIYAEVRARNALGDWSDWEATNTITLPTPLFTVSWSGAPATWDGAPTTWS